MGGKKHGREKTNKNKLRNGNLYIYNCITYFRFRYSILFGISLKQSRDTRFKK